MHWCSKKSTQMYVRVCIVNIELWKTSDVVRLLRFNNFDYKDFDYKDLIILFKSIESLVKIKISCNLSFSNKVLKNN